MQVIKFVEVQERNEFVNDPDAYEFRYDRKFHWLQKLCFFILRKIGAHYQTNVKFYTRTAKENDELLEQIFNQNNWLLDRMHSNNEKFELFIGPDQHVKLMELADFRSMWFTSMEGKIKIASKDKDATWYNMQIRLVPWMDGALVVPLKR